MNTKSLFLKSQARKGLFPVALIIASTFLALIIATSTDGWAGTTNVGNGDDGADLEGSVPIDNGPIVEARKKAVDKLLKLDVEGIPGLGKLIPEVRRTPLFISKRDVPADEANEGSRYHSDMSGMLFASTFTEPNAPTTFYPAAKTLNEDQLIALHIHEGLHRSLPSTVAEDENIVSQITVAITSPESSNDRIKAKILKLMPELDSPRMTFSPADGTMAAEKYPIPENAKVKRPSILGYSYKVFNNPQSAQDSSISPLTSMQTVQSFLYPFGNDKNPLGIGIELSFLNRVDSSTQMGPLNLSGRMRIWSSRGFDVGAWAVVSLNTLSAEEMKNTPYGRDVFSGGLSMQKDLQYFYIENLLGLTSQGTSSQQIGTVPYTYSYGSVVSATVRAGGKLGMFHMGVFGEIFLADYYRVSGGAFQFDSGRYEITSGGPEFTIEGNSWSVGIYGRFILNSTKDANFDYLGNVMGQGVGQGSIGGTVAIKL